MILKACLSKRILCCVLTREDLREETTFHTSLSVGTARLECRRRPFNFVASATALMSQPNSCRLSDTALVFRYQVLGPKTFALFPPRSDDPTFKVQYDHDNTYPITVARWESYYSITTVTGTRRTDRDLDPISYCANAVKPSSQKGFLQYSHHVPPGAG